MQRLIDDDDENNEPKLPSVAVQPFAAVQQSWIPAICNSFFGTGAHTRLVPRGAGIKRTSTLPHSPVTWKEPKMIVTLKCTSAYFAWDCVWRADFVTPIASSNRNHGEFGKNNGTTNGCCYFFWAFNTEANVTFTVTDNNDSLETGTLTGTGLFLNGHDFQNFVFQIGQKSIDDISLLERSVSCEILLRRGVERLTLTGSEKR